MKNNTKNTEDKHFFTLEEEIALVSALGRGQDGAGFTKPEAEMVLTAASKALVGATLWDGVLKGAFDVQIVNGEIVFRRNPKLSDAEFFALCDAHCSSLFRGNFGN